MKIGSPAQSTDFSLQVLAGTCCNTSGEAEVLERKKRTFGMTRNARTIPIAFALITFCNVASAQDQAQIEAGEQLYDEHCASCHGEKLRTTGSAADLKEMRAEDRPRFDRAMMEGRGQMPSWQGVLNEEEMNHMWAYIRSRAK